MADGADIVATWSVPMSNNIYKIEFCHGTTTGKRIVRINGKEVLRREWMFKLVGKELFELNSVRCVIAIEAMGIFAYEYSLKVGGKSFEKFREQQAKALQVWHVTLPLPQQPVAAASSSEKTSAPNKHTRGVRICLEKDSMEVWVNGSKATTTGEFMENGGTRTHFFVLPAAILDSSDDSGTPTNSADNNKPESVESSELSASSPSGGVPCFIETESSGKRALGILHKLYVDGDFIAPTVDGDAPLARDPKQRFQEGSKRK